MFDHSRPKTLFFWYLAVNSQRRAANDQDLTRGSPEIAVEGESKVLYLEKPPGR